jgi:hypothetical protein
MMNASARDTLHGQGAAVDDVADNILEPEFLDVDAAGPQDIDDALVRVNAHHVHPMTREHGGRGQADVTQPQDANGFDRGSGHCCLLPA